MVVLDNPVPVRCVCVYGFVSGDLRSLICDVVRLVLSTIVLFEMILIKSFWMFSVSADVKLKFDVDVDHWVPDPLCKYPVMVT